MASLNFNLDSSEFQNLLKDKVIELGEQIFTDSQNNIISQEIVDEGSLLNSGKFLVNDDSVEIRYDVLYAESIEFGRNPGSMPPVSKIQSWVKRKLGVTNDKEAKRIAFVIARDIKLNGTEPRPFLSPAVEKARLTLQNG